MKKITEKGYLFILTGLLLVMINPYIINLLTKPIKQFNINGNILIGTFLILGLIFLAFAIFLIHKGTIMIKMENKINQNLMSQTKPKQGFLELLVNIIIIGLAIFLGISILLGILIGMQMA